MKKSIIKNEIIKNNKKVKLMLIKTIKMNQTMN